VALISFDPDWTTVLSDGIVEHRQSGPGAPLKEALTTTQRPRPVLASMIVDRSVRETELRPAAELIDELGVQLVVPLPGGDEGALAGALLVGCSRWGLLRAQIAARLEGLAPRLGPHLRSAVVTEQAGRRIVELEKERELTEDRLEQLGYRLERLIEENRLLRSDRAGTRPTEIVGRSPAMKRLLSEIEHAATLESGVLIRGESGTGRRLVARSIQSASRRREAPFVLFDCAGTPATSHLTALVGQTDGEGTRPGLIELADGGTLVLEEVGALALEAQAELIHVLGSGEVSRAQLGDGGIMIRAIDVRVFGTTGRTSVRALERDTILPELHERLKTAEVLVPPLRERRGDIAELARLFLSKITEKLALDARAFTTEALNALEQHSWPGNVRQLRAVVELAALEARGRRITLNDLPPFGGAQQTSEAGQEQPNVLDGTFEEIERTALVHALAAADGNKAEAARQLGMKRSTFISRLRKHGL